MLVVARNSSFTYKGKPVKVQQVGAELGVRYVLEGSVLRADDRLRLTVQLMSSRIPGHHVWAERYDRNMEDFFALLDEIAQEIVTRSSSRVNAWRTGSEPGQRVRS